MYCAILLTSVTLQVIHGGNFDVDFGVYDQRNELVYSLEGRQYGAYTFNTAVPGDAMHCYDVVCRYLTEYSLRNCLVLLIQRKVAGHTEDALHQHDGM